jgi:5'-nucleotidase
MTAGMKITIAVSARACVGFEAGNQIFREKDPSAYRALQAMPWNVRASQGVAFPLMRKRLAFNSAESSAVRLAILLRDDPVTGLRAFTPAVEKSTDRTADCR